jgi:hypothetical protein
MDERQQNLGGGKGSEYYKDKKSFSKSFNSNK